jgi:ArsR family transcriptional regulator
MGMAKLLPTVPGKVEMETGEIARLFHALSDETRLAIVGRLMKGEQCVCDLVDILGGGQSRLSFHMKTLKEAGLVLDRRDGRWIHYSLNPEALAALSRFIDLLKKKALEVGSCCSR